jgi:hypothetical protein
MAGQQILAAVDVDVLVIARRQQTEQLAGAALAAHSQVEPHLAHLGADLRVQGRHVGVLAHVDPLRADAPGCITEALQIRVAQPRAVADLQIGGPAEPDRGAVR